MLTKFRTFTELQASVPSNGKTHVAVPSRLRSRCAGSAPLAGWRIVVKDNMHLKGVKTSLCNQAYYDTYPAPTKTAAFLQDLIELGCVILGKTKLCSFGHWEEPME